jgi:nucleotide-binding universal stress UspA family protein
MSPHFSVVVGHDFSPSGLTALQRAVALAARAPNHVLHVLCVVDAREPLPNIPADDGVDYRYAERVQDILALDVKDELEAIGAPTVHFFAYARIGKAADQILQLAREVGADSIVLGNHGLTGLERLLIGSTSEKVVREAGCSVEIVRPKRYDDVDLLDIVEVEPDHDHPYVPPHRYTYEERRVDLRPSDWPLY